MLAAISQVFQSTCLDWIRANIRELTSQYPPHFHQCTYTARARAVGFGVSSMRLQRKASFGSRTHDATANPDALKTYTKGTPGALHPKLELRTLQLRTPGTSASGAHVVTQRLHSERLDSSDRRGCRGQERKAPGSARGEIRTLNPKP